MTQNSTQETNDQLKVIMTRALLKNLPAVPRRKASSYLTLYSETPNTMLLSHRPFYYL